MDQGLIMARRSVCQGCVQSRVCPARWQWMACLAGREPVQISPEYVSGPETNCPLGHWTGVEPIDLEARRIEQVEHRRERRAVCIAAELLPFKVAKGDAAADELLSILLAAGRIDRDTVAEILKQLEAVDSESTAPR